MGGTASRPPLRTIVPETPVAEGANDEEEEGEGVDQGIDQLGVADVEQNYPAPSPRVRNQDPADDTDLSPDAVNTGTGSRVTTAPYSNDISGLVSPRSLTSPQPRIPVGAALQRHFKKPTDTNDRTVSVSPYPNFKAPFSPIPEVADETSPRLDINGRVSNELKLDLSGSLPGVVSESTYRADGQSKRNLMLRIRERMEQAQSTRASLSPLPSRKGQVIGPLSLRSSTGVSETKDTHKSNSRSPANTIDFEALQAAEMQKTHRAETFASIVQDLTKGLSSEGQKVKAILVWISKQRIGQLVFAPVPLQPDTPNGYMQLMQEGKGTFPVLFALLCRAANIKCAIINGVSKGSHYVLGSMETDGLSNSWNAVFVDGAWQLVHTLWVCKGLLGRREAGWETIETDAPSKTGNRRQEGREEIVNGKEIPAYNEYFIFTKPEEFIYRNFPDDAKWQLLEEPFTMEKFLSCSYLRPSFFQSEFKLLSEDKCSFVSEKGDPCSIVIEFKPSTSNNILFGYELRHKEETRSRKVDNNTTSKPEHIQERYVLMIKHEDKVTFEVRFGRKGTFKLRVFGGACSQIGKLPPWIMDVKLQCNNIAKTTKPLPFDPGIVGWGPSFISESKGLHVSSHQDCSIALVSNDPLCIQFILMEHLEMFVSVVQNNTDSKPLNECLVYEVLALGDIFELKITIRVSDEEMKILEEDEPALKLDVKDSSGQFSNACNYLIRKQANKEHEPFYVRRARKRLREAMLEAHPDALETAVNECLERGIQNTDSDLSGARVRLEFLQCRRELKTALLVNRIEVAQHAIQRTRNARLHVLLRREMARLSVHLKHLLKLNEGGWLSDIPDIDRSSLTEMGHLRKPKAEVQLTAIAVYLLLGVSEENLTTWGRIQHLLNDQDGTMIEMARLEKYIDTGETDLLTVDDRIRTRVREILVAFSEADVRRIDNTAAAFYLWARSIEEKLPNNLPEKDHEKAEEPKVKLPKPVNRPHRRDGPPVNTTTPEPSVGTVDRTIPGMSRTNTEATTPLNLRPRVLQSRINSVRSVVSGQLTPREQQVAVHTAVERRGTIAEAKHEADDVKQKTETITKPFARSTLSRIRRKESVRPPQNQGRETVKSGKPPASAEKRDANKTTEKQVVNSKPRPVRSGNIASNFQESDEPFRVRDKLTHSQLSIQVNKTQFSAKRDKQNPPSHRENLK